jgi:spore coat polysaccharide biosynthesis protein SpsF
MTKNRRLVAALACRAKGSRLYGKPLQPLDIKTQYTILDFIIDGLKARSEIDDIVLGIAEGNENLVFQEVAQKHGIPFIIGSEKDVLFRLIQCGRAGAATDVFRITTECPFIAWELLAPVWQAHVQHQNDITVTDYMAEGMNFEIYTQESLERSHAKGGEYERSEFCSAYPRRHPDEFKIEILKPAREAQRLDLRLTVDYPEDLYVCRQVYEALKHKNPHIPIQDIIQYLDAHPHLNNMLKSFIDTTPIWASVVDGKASAA